MFEWMISQNSIRPVFIVFPDAKEIMEGRNMVKDKDGNERSLRNLWQAAIARPGAQVIDIATEPDRGLKEIRVDGQTYSYEYSYICSRNERSNILSKVVVHNP